MDGLLLGFAFSPHNAGLLSNTFENVDLLRGAIPPTDQRRLVRGLEL